MTKAEENKKGILSLWCYKYYKWGKILNYGALYISSYWNALCCIWKIQWHLNYSRLGNIYFYDVPLSEDSYNFLLVYPSKYMNNYKTHTYTKSKL